MTNPTQTTKTSTQTASTDTQTTKTKPQNPTKLKKIYASLAFITGIVLTCATFLIINFSSQDFSQTQGESSGSTELIIATNDTMSEILTKTDSPTFVFVGRPTCPHCVKFKPILTNLLAKKPIATVYYYNTDEAKVKNKKRYSSIMNQIEVNAVPALIKIENGVKIAELENYKSESALITFLKN